MCLSVRCSTCQHERAAKRYAERAEEEARMIPSYSYLNS